MWGQHPRVRPPCLVSLLGNLGAGSPGNLGAKLTSRPNSLAR